MKKVIIIGVVSLVAVVVAMFLWSSHRPQPKTSGVEHDPNVVEVPIDAQRNARVVITPATEERLAQVVNTTGVISPDEARVAHIVPLSQGIVEDVLVQLGDRVRRDQPLLVYDNIELGESLGEYQNVRGTLDRALAQQEVARQSLERANALIKVQAISSREFEVRKAEFQQAVAEVTSRQAEVNRAEEKLHRFGVTDADLQKLNGSEHGTHRTASHASVRAPLTGVVTKYDVSKGEVVGREKEIFTIVDTSNVWALADVYEKDISLVSRGGDCVVSVVSYPQDAFKGKITYLSDALDPASRTAKLRCVLPNADGRLKLEMFAKVQVPTKETRTGVTVPVSALQEVSGQTVVFVQTKPDRFEKRAVQVGEKNEQRAEILSGVQNGDNVVGDGSFYMKSALLRETMGEED